jgi:hypothetical protein
MSKSNFNKKDLQMLAKFIVDEKEKIQNEKEKKQIEKDEMKNKKKIIEMLNDEDIKKDLIDEFISDILDDEDDFIDVDYFSNVNKSFYNLIPDSENIVKDISKEAKDYNKKLYEKYRYVLNTKLDSIGY